MDETMDFQMPESADSGISQSEQADAFGNQAAGQMPQGRPDQPPVSDSQQWSLNPADYDNLDGEFIKGYSAIAKDIGLSERQAGGLLSRAYDLIQKQESVIVEKQANEWRNASLNDREFGGRNFAANLDIAQNAVAEWGNEALVKILNESGLGNHPEMIRFFWKAGQAISEDSFMRGGTSQNQPVSSFEQAAARLFPSMKQQ